MDKIFTALGDAIAILAVLVGWTMPFLLAVAVIDALTAKTFINWVKSKPTWVTALSKAGVVFRPFWSFLSICRGFTLATLCYAWIILPWIPAIFTIPQGTPMRPMTWAVTAVLVSGVAALIGAPLSVVDILRGATSKDRSRNSRMLGITLGAIGTAANLYAFQFSREFLFGIAAWRGWIIED